MSNNIVSRTILFVTNKNLKSDEDILVAAINRGDQDAFKQIIEAYQDKIMRVCMGFVGNREDAEDLAQDVFIQLFKSSSGLRGEARLSTWLYRVAVNKSLNHIRSRKLKKQYENIEISDAFDPASGEEADDRIKASDHRKALREAIGRLPENQRTAFILQKYEELSYEEISKVMKLSLSSVQSLIFRARKNLQDYLLEYFRKNFT